MLTTQPYQIKLASQPEDKNPQECQPSLAPGRLMTLKKDSILSMGQTQGKKKESTVHDLPRGTEM